MRRLLPKRRFTHLRLRYSVACGSHRPRRYLLWSKSKASFVYVGGLNVLSGRGFANAAGTATTPEQIQRQFFPARSTP